MPWVAVDELGFYRKVDSMILRKSQEVNKPCRPSAMLLLDVIRSKAVLSCLKCIRSH